jgi:hypothetical protein
MTDWHCKKFFEPSMHKLNPINYYYCDGKKKKTEYKKIRKNRFDLENKLYI